MMSLEKRSKAGGTVAEDKKTLQGSCDRKKGGRCDGALGEQKKVSGISGQGRRHAKGDSLGKPKGQRKHHRPQNNNGGGKGCEKTFSLRKGTNFLFSKVVKGRDDTM